MNVNTNYYLFAHSKSPKGFGVWIFQNGSKTDGIHVRAMYSDAKKQALKEAKKRGWTDIILAS